MSTVNALALERWLAEQPLDDELNEVVVPALFVSARTATSPDSDKELSE